MCSSGHCADEFSLKKQLGIYGENPLGRFHVVMSRRIAFSLLGFSREEGNIFYMGYEGNALLVS